jgi:hypothetical protein
MSRSGARVRERYNRRRIPDAPAPIHERTVATTEALLGPDALEQDQARGRALTAEAAVALAINAE